MPSTTPALVRPTRSLVRSVGLLASLALAGAAHASGDGLGFRFEPAATPDALVAPGALQDEPLVSIDAVNADEADDDGGLVAPDVRVPFATEGTTRLKAWVGYGADVKENDAWLAIGGLGFSWFIDDGLALAFEINGLHVQQPGPDAEGANMAVLFEWHFHRARDWSLFLDAGAGVLFTTSDVPELGSSFNFTPQAGFGATLEVAEDVRLVAGVKWHHISNANTFEENPGRDSILGYVGLSFPF